MSNCRVPGFLKTLMILQQLQKTPLYRGFIELNRSILGNSVFPALLRLPGCPGALAELSSQLPPDLVCLTPEAHFPLRTFHLSQPLVRRAPRSVSTSETSAIVRAQIQFLSLQVQRRVCSVVWFPGFAPGGLEREWKGMFLETLITHSVIPQ